MSKTVKINRRKKILHLRWQKTGPIYFVDVDNVPPFGRSVQAQVIGYHAILRVKGSLVRYAPPPMASSHAAKLWANRKLKTLLNLA